MSRILYLGTDPTRYPENVLHFPIIAIAPCKITREEEEKAMVFFQRSTDLLLTSRNGVETFFTLFGKWKGILEKNVFAVGPATRDLLRKKGVEKVLMPEEYSQEGLLSLLGNELGGRSFFYPASADARPLLRNAIVERGGEVFFFPLYRTVIKRGDNHPPFQQIEKIVFTSPSTVKAFIELYGREFLMQKKIEAIGPVTKKVLVELLRERKNIS